jgi:hypothetical protein
MAFPQEGKLARWRVDVLVLRRRSGRESRIEGAGVAIAATLHFRDQRLVPAIESRELPSPSPRLGMMGVPFAVL